MADQNMVKIQAVQGAVVFRIWNGIPDVKLKGRRIPGSGNLSFGWELFFQIR